MKMKVKGDIICLDCHKVEEFDCLDDIDWRVFRPASDYVCFEGVCPRCWEFRLQSDIIDGIEEIL